MGAAVIGADLDRLLGLVGAGVVRLDVGARAGGQRRVDRHREDPGRVVQPVLVRRDPQRLAAVQGLQRVAHRIGRRRVSRARVDPGVPHHRPRDLLDHRTLGVQQVDATVPGQLRGQTRESQREQPGVHGAALAQHDRLLDPVGGRGLDQVGVGEHLGEGGAVLAGGGRHRGRALQPERHLVALRRPQPDQVGRVALRGQVDGDPAGPRGQPAVGPAGQGGIQRRPGAVGLLAVDLTGVDPAGDRAVGVAEDVLAGARGLRHPAAAGRIEAAATGTAGPDGLGRDRVTGVGGQLTGGPAERPPGAAPGVRGRGRHLLGRTARAAGLLPGSLRRPGRGLREVRPQPGQPAEARPVAAGVTGNRAAQADHQGGGQHEGHPPGEPARRRTGPSPYSAPLHLVLPLPGTGQAPRPGRAMRKPASGRAWARTDEAVDPRLPNSITPCDAAAGRSHRPFPAVHAFVPEGWDGACHTCLEVINGPCPDHPVQPGMAPPADGSTRQTGAGPARRQGPILIGCSSGLRQGRPHAGGASRWLYGDAPPALSITAWSTTAKSSKSSAQGSMAIGAPFWTW